MNNINKKIKICLIYKMVIAFILLFSFNTFSAAPDIIGFNPNVKTNVGPGETTVPETTKKNWGVKVDNAQYYDYVEYDDQGRLVDKNHIIIAEGQGGLGSGGGNSGQGSKSNNSAGSSNGGVSNKKDNTQGIANAQRQGELARYNEYQQRLNESARQAEIARIRNAMNNAYQVTNGAQVKDVDSGFDETTSIRYIPDETIHAPVSNGTTYNNYLPPKETQPKINPNGPVITEVTKEYETIQQTTLVPFEQNLDIAIQESMIIESENVAATDIYNYATFATRKKIKKTEDDLSVGEETQEESIQEETTVESNEEQTDPVKQGEDGETDRNDTEAAFYNEGGDNIKDGRGDSIGETNRGVKIFVIDRKGNIGIEEKSGINNIEPLVVGILVSLLLLIGAFYYYVPYIFVSKKRKKSNYII